MSTFTTPRPAGPLCAPPVATACDASLIAFLRQFDHDLRTPLGTMAAAVDLLRDEAPASVSHAESIAVLERQIARLHALTQSLREYAQGLSPAGVAQREGR